MNKFTNNKKAIEFGNPFWDKTEEYGLINIVAKNLGHGKLISQQEHQFINMCSYSYLGLDSHPSIIKGAIDGILSTNTLNSSISRVRVSLNLLKEVEDILTGLFQAEAITLPSCSAASSAILPLIAAGIFTNNKPPVMIFDKHAHFSINLIKPICADETEVLTSPHNDLNYIEDICKKHKNVAYVADGVYSTGGVAPVKELITLQDKYGLFLFFDEAHSTSVYGANGKGYVLELMGGINSKTIVVSSLNKGFGASGGLLLLGSQNHLKVVKRFGGPLSWSQRVNTAGLGAIKASAQIHKSNELITLQESLHNNIKLFDTLIDTGEKGDSLPIRLIPIGEAEKAVEIAKNVFDSGFYTSPLFFPIVPRNKAGLRVMIRSDLTSEQIKLFCNRVTEAIKNV